MLRKIEVPEYNGEDLVRVIMRTGEEGIALSPLQSGNVLVTNGPGKWFRRGPLKENFPYQYSIWKQDNTQLGPYPIKDKKQQDKQMEEETKETRYSPLLEQKLDALAQKIKADYDFHEFSFLHVFRGGYTFLCSTHRELYVYDSRYHELFVTSFSHVKALGDSLAVMPNDQFIHTHRVTDKSIYDEYTRQLIEFKHTVKQKEAAKINKEKLPSLLESVLTMFSAPLRRLVVDHLDGHVDEKLSTYYPQVKKR